ncbi:MAG: ABC transporter permease [Verrucomicrobiales bacterium]|nr:ABC transporter permease [Verrucomicrobiales bacterium]
MSASIVDTATNSADEKAFRKPGIRYNPNRVAHNLNKLGLGYFSPFARLIGRDEPAKQVREILTNTLLPVVAFAVFILIWSVLASIVKTDSVQIPSPHQSWYALTGKAIPLLGHPFPDSVDGHSKPYFAENEGLDPKSINGFAAAEKANAQKYYVSQNERVQKFKDRATAAEKEGDSEKAEKYRGNAEMFASKTYQGNKTFYDQIWISLLTILIGFVIATLIAIPIGVLCGISPLFNVAVNPLIQLFKPVSPLAWFPIVFVLTTWGIDTPPSDSIWQRALWTSAGVVMLCSLWPTLINTAVGVASVDRDHLNVAKVLKLGWFKRIWKIVLPASLPLIFTGLRLSIGVGWMVLIAADMMAQNQGLGKFVWDMYQNGDTMSTAQIIVAVFVIGGIGFFLDRIMLVFQRLVTFEDQSI